MQELGIPGWTGLAEALLGCDERYICCLLFLSIFALALFSAFLILASSPESLARSSVTYSFTINHPTSDLSARRINLFCLSIDFITPFRCLKVFLSLVSLAMFSILALISKLNLNCCMLPLRLSLVKLSLSTDSRFRASRVPDFRDDNLSSKYFLKSSN